MTSPTVQSSSISVQPSDGNIYLAGEIERKGDSGNNEINASPTEIQIDHIHGYEGHDTLRGFGGSDILEGGDGNDVLDGGSGIDKLYGGNGDDTYHVDHLGDQAIELDSDTGFDTVITTVGWVLKNSNIEVFMASDELVDGKPRNINLAVRTLGNDSQTLIGNNGNNVLDGGTGIDTLRGRGGDDTYVVRDSRVVIEERTGEGSDTLTSYVNYTLAAGVHVEVLDLSAPGSVGTKLKGNEIDNKLIGNGHDNVLNGGGGADTLAAGYGNDTYILDNENDIIEEIEGKGDDKAITSVSYALGKDVHVEILMAADGLGDIDLTGNKFDNTLLGNAGSNVLRGGIGADTLDGGEGIDTASYEDADRGLVIDLANTDASTGLAKGDKYRSIEILAASHHADDISGTDDRDVMKAGDGADIVRGRGGHDRLDGQAGNDILEGGDDGDALHGGEGIDEAIYIRSASAVTVNLQTGRGQGGEAEGDLYVEIENVRGSNHADRLIGNAVANTLRGEDGRDTLDGGIGIDIMIGGADNDTYYADDAGDVIVEDVGGGVDTVNVTCSYTLSANVENLTASGRAAVSITGNASNNLIVGNPAGNVINGGAGADRMEGGGGSDIYFVDSKADHITEAAGGGAADKVVTSVSYTLSAEVENLTASGAASGMAAISLVGNALGNTIVGNAACNSFDGGSGNDVLSGGAGVDTFAFTTALDRKGNVDAITDFNGKDDTIQLDNAIFKKLGKAGKLKKGFFTIGDKAKEKNDFLVYKIDTGELFYDADGCGKGKAVLFAKLVDGIRITAEDFRII
jgi:Ca2+-binding RTX toxin-like protein